MPLLTLESVSLAYGHVALLDRVDLALDGGDKVALIGRNGTGKSSLLRIVAGTASPDDGVVWRTPGLRLAHVPQEPQFAPGQSVFEAAAEGLGDMRRLLGEYERVAHALEGGRDDALLARLEELSAQLESGEGWRLKSRVETVLSRLHLPAHALVEALSGGQKKRAALARALVVEPELMLLDEPTNHLDIESIQWLEELLVSFAGALLFVTHDRTFLDRVATRVIELDRGRLSSFPGSYSAFRQRKSEQLAQEATVNDKFDKLLAQEEAWIRRGVEARRTREQWRIRRLEELRRQRGERRERLGSVSLAVEEGVRSGQLVAELSHVSKSFAGAAERGAGAPLGGDATAEARTALDARSDTSAALGREGAAERGAGAPLGGDATAEARTALDARSDTSAALGREGAAERGAGAPLVGDATAEARTALDARSDTSAALGREGAAERGAGAPLVGDATAEARTALDARSDTSAALGREGAAERAALDAGSDTPIPFVGEGKPVVEDFTCRILRGDKVGLIGPNGAGKTTLLRLILGDLQPDAGTVRRGTRLSAAYYDQFRTQLDEEASVLDTVGQGSDYVEVAGERKHVMSYLGDFLFSPERVRSPVKSLSGGERNRLLLARLFTRSSNLLVLDEPTNDLDIETLELLEALLQDYSGTVLLVSHDRAFLDNVVTQVIAFDGDGRWLENPGGYQEWARVLRAREEGGRASGSEAQPASRAQSIRTARAPKLSWKEQQELKELPARIEALEREQGELARQLADPAFYGSAPAQVVRDANSRFQELEALLLAALERWTELEAKGK